MPAVVSLRGRLGDPDLDPALNPAVVYVGRRQWWGPGRLLDGHRLANPYSVRRYGRAEALRLYRARLATLPDLAELLAALRGKTLACWCAPEPCHADVLAELLGADDPTTEGLPMTTRPAVVCLCGSTRFRDQFAEANRTLTLSGRIVLAPGVFAHADGIPISDNEKAALDALHLAKIDLADEVFVVNVGGYIGASTTAEIAYATTHGKPVRYLEPGDAPTGRA